MKKKYKNGLVLGKIYPITKGHLYLIDTAIENCDMVHVILTHNKLQSIPGEIRYESLKSIYKNKKYVKIYSVSDDGLPQYDCECKTLDEFYSYWIPLVYDTVDELDCVFTSEDYGVEFSKYLGIEHYLVDKDRIKYPISGTKVRENPLENWDLIAKEIQYFFVKRIVVMGPESTGKSTMVKKLSEYYNTNFVEEWGRTFYENNGNKIELNDFITISNERQDLENSLIKDSNKILFSDTEDITTYIFSKLFFPNDYTKIEEYFLEKIKNSKKYDLYILLKTDCDGVQDGTREFLNKRDEHYSLILNELIRNNCNFVEIGGSFDERFNESISIIENSILKNNI